MACKPASAVDRSWSPTEMTSCANNLLNEASHGTVMTAVGVPLFKKLAGRGGHHRVIVVSVECQSACSTRQRPVLLTDAPVY